MTMAEDFETSKKAYQFLAGHVDEWKKGVEKGYKGLSHRVNQQDSEIVDLGEKIVDLGGINERVSEDLSELSVTVDKIAAYLKKKFPEDFGDKS